MNNKLIRIWVVVDNPRKVDLLRNAFKRAGLNFDVLAIEAGALLLMPLEEMSGKASAPDLVILDSSLSQADGNEVLQAMRQKNVPVMMTSSLISPSDRAKKVEDFFQITAAVKEASPRSATRVPGHPIPDRADRQS